MATKLVQVRLPEKYVEHLDLMVKNGHYASRSEIIRSSLRDLVKWGRGSLPDTGDSVKEVRKLRRELDKLDLTADEINDTDTPLDVLLARRAARKG